MDTIISKLKAEIERRIGAIAKAPSDNGVMDSINGARRHELMKLLSFLSTLEEPVCNDLEKAAIDNAAKEYAFNNSDDSQEYMNGYLGFKAGAEWDREQMMKDAVEGRVSYLESREVAVIYYDDPKGNTMCFFAPSSSLETGDKVRIIIVKKD